jgi:hypothetical protein
MLHGITGTDGIWWEVGFFLNLCVHVPVTLLVAGAFTRVFDDKALRFSKWLDTTVSADRGRAGYQVLPMQDLQSN